MATQIQHRRGTTVEHQTFTGKVGEITVDTTKDTAVIHDGTTAGGHPLATEAYTDTAIDEAFDALTAADIPTSAEGVNIQGALDGVTTQLAAIPNKPRLSINQFLCRAGSEMTDVVDGSYITFESVYQTLSHSTKNTGVIYGLEVFVSGRNSQRIVKSYDGGANWVLIQKMTITSATEKFTKIFVAPDSETILLLKSVNWNDAPNQRQVVCAYTSNLLTLLGAKDIGKHTWLSPESSVDSYYSGGQVIMFAEYWIPGSGSVTDFNVWKSTDFGANWVAVKTFAYGTGANQVGHIHTLQIDPYTGHIWLATGDGDLAAQIWRSTDGGSNWVVMGGGFSGSNQTYRTTCFLFEPDYIYYGMDCPTEGVPTYIYRVLKSTLDRSLGAGEQPLDTREIIGRQTDDHAIYCLSRTWFPAGFLVFSVLEPTSAQGDRCRIEWYSFDTGKLYVVAEVPRLGKTEAFWGFNSASRYQCTSSGIIIIGTSAWGLSTSRALSNSIQTTSKFFAVKTIV